MSDVTELPRRCECQVIGRELFDASDCPAHHDCGVEGCRGASTHTEDHWDQHEKRNYMTGGDS